MKNTIATGAMTSVLTRYFHEVHNGTLKLVMSGAKEKSIELNAIQTLLANSKMAAKL